MTCTSCGADLPDGAKFCTSCGHGVEGAAEGPGADGPSPGDTVELSAAGGAAGPPPGSPPADPAATPTLPEQTPPTSWQPAPGPPGVPQGPPTGPPTAPPGPPAGRGWGRGGLILAVGAAVVGVLGVLVIGFFLFQGLFGDDQGGASSPEAAVEDLQQAVNDEDAIGVIDSLNPEEVEPLVEVYEQLASQSEANNIFELDDGELPTGLDVQVEDLELEVEQVSDEVAKVTIVSGEGRAVLEAATEQMSAVAEGTDVPVVDFGTSALGGEEGMDATLEGETDAEEVGDELLDGEDPFLMVVDDGDGWYVSPSYTTAEIVAELNDWDSAEPVDGDDAAGGAESPEAAVEQMAQAIEGFDLEAGSQALPPGEARWARDYLESIIDGLGEADIEESLEDHEPQLEDLQLRVEEQGDGEALVVIEQLAFSYVDDDGDDVTVELSDDCLAVDDGDSGGDSEGDEGGDDDATCLEEALVEDFSDPALAELVPDEQVVVTVEEDGGWFVSPVRTSAHYVSYALENLDEGHVRALGLVRPTPIDPGDTVEGELVNSYVIDRYTFQGEEGEIYVTTGQSEADDPNGDPIEIVTDPSVAVPEEDGPVTVEVGHVFDYDDEDAVSTDPIPYDVEVAQAEPTGDVLGPNDEVEGEFTNEEPFVLYEVDVSGSTADGVDVTVDGDFADARFFEPGESYPLTSVDQEDPETFLYPEDGELLLVVTAAPGVDGGDFTVIFEEDDGGSSGGSDGDGETAAGDYDIIDGEIAPNTTETHTLPADGSCYDVEAYDGDDEFDPYLRVFDAAGTLVDTDDDGGLYDLDAYLSFCTEDTGGQYRVEVSGATAEGGTFTLYVDRY